MLLVVITCGCTPLLHYQQFKTNKEVKELKQEVKELKQKNGDTTIEEIK